MSHFLLGQYVLLALLLRLPIRLRQSIMLPDMLGPGCNNESFNKAVGLLEIAKNAPSLRAISSPDSSEPTNRFQKFRSSFRCDFIFDGDQDRAEALVGGHNLLAHR